MHCPGIPLWTGSLYVTLTLISLSALSTPLKTNLRHFANRSPHGYPSSFTRIYFGSLALTPVLQ